MARGYLNRPELTAERFIDDPFVPGLVSIAPVILDAIGRTAASNSSGATTIRSRFAASVSNSARSRRRSPAAIRRCVKRWSSRVHGSRMRQDRPTSRLVTMVAEIDAGALREYLGRVCPTTWCLGLRWCLDALPLTPNGKLGSSRIARPAMAKPRRLYRAPRLLEHAAPPRMLGQRGSAPEDFQCPGTRFRHRAALRDARPTSRLTCRCPASRLPAEALQEESPRSSQRHETAAALCKHLNAPRVCRCPSHRNVCGSSNSSTPDSPPITSRSPCVCSGALDVPRSMPL